MAVEIEWIDSISPAATGNKIYRDTVPSTGEVEIADIANGVQFYSDSTVAEGTQYKFEVQAHDGAGDETTQEVEGENMDYITTAGGVSELYPISDAASIDNEANLVASEWSYNASVSIASSAVDPQSGSFCLELTADIDGGGNYRGLQLDLEAGETYNYSFYSKGETGAARCRAWFGTVASPDHTITTSWAEYSGTFEVTTGLVTINFQPEADTTAGDTMFVDTFTITKV